MGYRFQLKKAEREKLLREKRKGELLGTVGDLFGQNPEPYSITYSCQIRKQIASLVSSGTIGMLLIDNLRVVFWNKQGTLGEIVPEDVVEISAILEKLPGDAPACLAQVVSGPDEFNICQLVLQHGQ
jgi:hypothetical protein